VGSRPWGAGSSTFDREQWGNIIAVPPVAVTALSVALLLSLVTVLVLSVVLSRTRRRVAVLEARLEPPGPASRAVQAAGWAVKTAVHTAQRVRQQGVSQLLMSSIEDFTGLVLADRREIERVMRPDGTVTVFFSDIEGSTVLNERLGDKDWVRLLQAHEALVTDHVERNAGHVVKSQGDGFMVVFPEPGQAVAAAAGIQAELDGATRRWIRRTPVRVRMGIHTGRVVAREGDYYGMNVAMAARVAALACGGQVLVTDGVRDQVADREFAEWADAVELRGIGGTHRLWELAA